MDIKKDPIPPEHFYVPQEENDPVRDTIHQIFREAAKLIIMDATLTREQQMAMLEEGIRQLLLDTFTSRHANPTTQVIIGTNNDREAFHMVANVYGYSFSATLS